MANFCRCFVPYIMFTLVCFLKGNEGSNLTESEHIYSVNLNEKFNLEAIMPCDPCFRFSEACPSKHFEVSLNNSGWYRCGDEDIFIFPMEKELTFQCVSCENSSNPPLIGEPAILECSLAFKSLHHIESELAVYDECGSFFVPAKDDAYESKFEVPYERIFRIKLEFFTTGIIPFSCKWTYAARMDEIVAKRSLVKTINITVYSPPANVQPDKTEARAHQTIVCISDAYPEAEYAWICYDGKWSTNGSSLVGYDPGQYICNCTAKNVIGEVVKTNYWKDIITIVSRASRLISFGIYNMLAGLTVTILRVQASLSLIRLR